ncbi:hypothetical protein PMAYCL1PPCAC_27980, partial [Pristionchus mayeri]
DRTGGLVEEMKRMEERARGRRVPSKRVAGDRDRNELIYLIEKMKRFEYILDRAPHRPIKVYCDYFPLLSLPDELITHVLSFLSIEDRMKARVNKKMDAIELASKYSLKKLTIGELAEGMSGMRKFANKFLPYNLYRNEQSIMLRRGISCSD